MNRKTKQWHRHVSLKIFCPSVAYCAVWKTGDRHWRLVWTDCCSNTRRSELLRRISEGCDSVMSEWVRECVRIVRGAVTLYLGSLVNNGVRRMERRRVVRGGDWTGGGGGWWGDGEGGSGGLLSACLDKRVDITSLLQSRVMKCPLVTWFVFFCFFVAFFYFWVTR